jgi:transposase-like protein
MEQRKANKGARTRERMYELIENHKNSGQGVKEYCRHHGVPPSVWYYWKKRYEGDKEPTGFASIQVEGIGGMCEVQAEIEIAGLGIVRLCGQVSAGYIRELLGLEA